MLHAMHRIALALTLTAAACGPDPLHPADIDHDATDTGIEPDGSSSSDGSSSDGSSSGEPADSDSETGDDRPEDPSQPGSCEPITREEWRDERAALERLRRECPPCLFGQFGRCCSELGECGCTGGTTCCPRGTTWRPHANGGYCDDGELGDYCTTADDCPGVWNCYQQEDRWPEWGICGP